MTATATTARETAPAALEVHDVHKWYGTHRVLDGIDLTVRPGEVTVVIGPSGSGKSTLLRVINHLEKPEIGHVSVGGELIGVRRVGDRLKELAERAILAQRGRIGFVFQNFNLFPHLTVLDNLAAAPVATGRLGKAEARALARELLTRVGLGERTGAYPRQLSGGQQQRVAIARALTNRPELLLADEPTGNLDSQTSVEVMGVFQQLNDQGITIVMVTHELDIAQYCKRNLVLRDGRLVSDVQVQNRLISATELAKLRAAETNASLTTG